MLRLNTASRCQRHHHVHNKPRGLPEPVPQRRRPRGGIPGTGGQRGRHASRPAQVMHPETISVDRGFISNFAVCVVTAAVRISLKFLASLHKSLARIKISFTVPPEVNHTRLNFPIFCKDSHVPDLFIISLTELRGFASQVLMNNWLQHRCFLMDSNTSRPIWKQILYHSTRGPLYKCICAQYLSKESSRWQA